MPRALSEVPTSSEKYAVEITIMATEASRKTCLAVSRSKSKMAPSVLVRTSSPAQAAESTTKRIALRSSSAR